MKNRHLSLLAILLSLETIGCADQAILRKDFKKENIPYHNRVMLFTPGHIGYERIKPNGMYVGVEAFESPVFNKRRRTFVDAELRIGRNALYNGRDHLTPFLMLGCAGANHTRNFLDFNYRFKEWGIAYGGVGFLYGHQFDSLFDLGVNAKLLLGGTVTQKHKKLGSPNVGIDIAVPFTFRFGNGKHWDFRLEPFFFGLHGQKGSLGYFGWRNSFGYRF